MHKKTYQTKRKTTQKKTKTKSKTKVKMQGGKAKAKTAHSRTFVLVTANGKQMGRYVSKTPSGAAKKIGGRLLKKRDQMSVTIRVRETTQGSKKKMYMYVVQRVKLSQRKVVMRDGKRISYQFKTVIKAKK